MLRTAAFSAVFVILKASKEFCIYRDVGISRVICIGLQHSASNVFIARPGSDLSLSWKRGERLRICLPKVQLRRLYDIDRQPGRPCKSMIAERPTVPGRPSDRRPQEPSIVPPEHQHKEQREQKVELLAPALSKKGGCAY